jgi:Asp-tRNA(Asn)/Glu-tRNA(Gln) amidotransferase A subunit family amidase
MLKLTARQLREKIASRQISSVEATQAVFAAIEKYEPIVGAYISTFREEALERSAKSFKWLSKQVAALA